MAKTPKTFKTRVQEKLEDEDSYRDLYTEALDKIEEQMDDDIVNNSDLEKKPSLIKDAIRKVREDYVAEIEKDWKNKPNNNKKIEASIDW